VILNELPRTADGRLVPNPDSPVELFRYREYTIAHEIAHQWWGQAVTWDRYRDQWLSEGLAQFAAARYIRERQGERAYLAILKRSPTRAILDFGPTTLGSRISYLDFTAYQAVVYNSGHGAPDVDLPRTSSSDCAVPSPSLRRPDASVHRHHGRRGPGPGGVLQGWFDSTFRPRPRS
jgi:hypothetical protein